MKTPGRILLLAACAVAAVIVLGPIFWALSTSLKSNSHIFAVPPRWIPDEPSLEHFRRLLAEGVHWSFLNSALYSVSAVAAAVAIGAVAGYALVRYPIPGKKLLLVLFMGVMAIPSYALLLPTQIVFVNLGLFDTRLALPILYAAHVIPFAVWMTRAHFAAMPRELEQAALVDGYSRFEAVWKVILPGARPALIAAAAFGFLYSWNDYITATTMIESPDLRTLPVALIFFQGFHGRDWGALMAGVVIATLPPVTLFLVYRRYLIGGFAEGSVKG
ncbi:carbohydrate ABC transporter permease [Bosea sp. (in: a-proteobacteria)]|jgi:ABC-type glycerol-3-phosphate transport system permease component|uniref:carbohydrate ABC transporter permease n=1 Tax=Bosea sp. (in: a-proteobacteria) TaxID=1871050 RepID=UPI003F7298DE